jgi:hypothetical protein
MAQHSLFLNDGAGLASPCPCTSMRCIPLLGGGASLQGGIAWHACWDGSWQRSSLAYRQNNSRREAQPLTWSVPCSRLLLLLPSPAAWWVLQNFAPAGPCRACAGHHAAAVPGEAARAGPGGAAAAPAGPGAAARRPGEPAGAVADSHGRGRRERGPEPRPPGKALTACSFWARRACMLATACSFESFAPEVTSEVSGMASTCCPEWHATEEHCLARRGALLA